MNKRETYHPKQDGTETNDDLIISIVAPRPDPTTVEQHLCMDRGYDYDDAHQFVERVRYLAMSNTAGDAVSHPLNSARFRAKPSFRLVGGSSNAPSTGSLNGAVCGSAGVRKLGIGWRSFRLLALTL
jgi:hypothetical protein